MPWPKRYWKIGQTRRPLASSTAAIASTSARLRATGFSTTTWKPASSAAIAWAWCSPEGVQTSMTSRSCSNSRSSRSTGAGTANFAATALPRSASMSQSAATSYMSGSSRYASMCEAPMPDPTTPTLSRLTAPA